MLIGAIARRARFFSRTERGAEMLISAHHCIHGSERCGICALLSACGAQIHMAGTLAALGFGICGYIFWHLSMPAKKLGTHLAGCGSNLWSLEDSVPQNHVRLRRPRNEARVQRGPLHMGRL